jgi:hypothetical protein
MFQLIHVARPANLPSTTTNSYLDAYLAAYRQRRAKNTRLYNPNPSAPL